MRSEALTAAPTQPMTPGPTQVEVTLPVRRHRCEGAPQSALSEPGQPQIPRITRLMALAIKFQSMVDRGEVRDYADIARLGYVSRARLTQIMNLLNLAPEIQEQILLVQCSLGGERQLRPITAKASWDEQRHLWRAFAQQS